MWKKVRIEVGVMASCMVYSTIEVPEKFIDAEGGYAYLEDYAASIGVDSVQALFNKGVITSEIESYELDDMKLDDVESTVIDE